MYCQCQLWQVWARDDFIPDYATVDMAVSHFMSLCRGSYLTKVHDLSSPDRSSVNDGIYRDDFSPDYATVDMAVSHIMSLGRGSYLTKVDAFRLCPVQPSQWFLLGIYWEKQYYYDRILPFGLRSALFIFDKFADSLQWILQNTCKLQRILHYLDDLLDVAVEPRSASPHHWGQRVVECCSSAITKQWSCALSQALAAHNLSWPSFAACTIPVSHIIPWSLLSTFWALLIPLQGCHTCGPKNLTEVWVHRPQWGSRRQRPVE